jgi:hypothetical protein
MRSDGMVELGRDCKGAFPSPPGEKVLEARKMATEWWDWVPRHGESGIAIRASPAATVRRALLRSPLSPALSRRERGLFDHGC